MKQAYISKSLVGLDFRKKYNLAEYSDTSGPLVMFGMYSEEDLETFMKHKGELTLVWQGMDAKEFKQFDKLKKKECKHYAISHWIQQSLELNGIECTYAPVSATIGVASPLPRGNSIYFYTSKMSQESSDYYGEFMIEEIRQRTGLNVHICTHETHTKECLFEIYKDCFINLRLTQWDGCPNTNLEIGLLGRRSVFNGLIPGSIPWANVDGIVKSIMEEFYRRHHYNGDIAELTDIYVNSVNKLFL